MHLSVKIYGMAQNMSCRSSLRGLFFGADSGTGRISPNCSRVTSLGYGVRIRFLPSFILVWKYHITFKTF